MHTELWSQLKEVFGEALELPAAEREEYARRVCAGRPELRDELLVLLAELDRVEETFLGRAVADRALALLDAEHRPSLVGRQIGSWRLVEEIGGGGMGVVYLAERVAGGFRQQGALKMVAGVPGRELLRRLEAERQMLAGLTHPGIARLLDGGTTEEGYPYLVMEYVAGEHITDYCRRCRLSADERIDLVLAVCAAVQSAHQNLIVHQDLKPSNILVTADGEPKLLDFGIAKLLSAEGEPAHRTELSALTPMYASPEQVHGRPISTASDVFSLGVLLYELLTGRLPFGPADAPLAEIAQRMETEPPAPSSVLGDSPPDGADTIAGRARRSRIGARRDLDAIVLKALCVEPEQRYPTVDAFAQELLRERRGEPVAARGEAFSYRALRFLLRHRAAIAAAAIVTASLVGAAFVSQREARIARQERSKAVRIRSALERILWSPNPDWYAGGGNAEVQMATVLKGASKWLPDALADLPEEEARMRYSLGTTLAALGELEPSERELRRARELHEEIWGRDHPETAKATAALGGIVEMRGRHREAAAEFRRVLEICRRADCNAFLDYLVPGTYWALGLSQMALGEDAEAALRTALDLRRDQGHTEDALSANVLIALGNVHENRGDLEAAEGFFRRAFDFAVGPERAGALLNLGQMHKIQGRLGEARRELEEAHRVAAGAIGPNHYSLGRAEAHLAHLDLLDGDLARARQRIDEALTRLRGSLTEDSQGVAHARAVRAEVLLSAGEAAAAEEELRDAIAGLEKHLPADSWQLATARSVLGRCLVERGHREEGRRVLSEAHGQLARTLGPEDPRTLAVAKRLRELGRPG